MAYDVFISYRRQGGGADARMMYDRLVQAGYEVGTFEEFNHILEEASRLNKMLREVKKAEKAA